jgi:hypothetical protein
MIHGESWRPKKKIPQARKKGRKTVHPQNRNKVNKKARNKSSIEESGKREILRNTESRSRQVHLARQGGPDGLNFGADPKRIRAAKHQIEKEIIGGSFISKIEVFWGLG